MKTKSLSSINKTEVYEAWLEHYTKVSKRSRCEAAEKAMAKALTAFTPTLEELELDARIATMHEAITNGTKLHTFAVQAAKELGVPLIKLTIGKPVNFRVGQEERESNASFEAEALEAFQRR